MGGFSSECHEIRNRCHEKAKMKHGTFEWKMEKFKRVRNSTSKIGVSFKSVL